MLKCYDNKLVMKCSYVDLVKNIYIHKKNNK